MAAPKDKRVFSELSHHKGLSDEVRNSITLDVEGVRFHSTKKHPEGCCD